MIRDAAALDAAERIVRALLVSPTDPQQRMATLIIASIILNAVERDERDQRTAQRLQLVKGAP